MKAINHEFSTPIVRETPLVRETTATDDFATLGAAEREDLENYDRCIIQMAKAMVAHETAHYPIRLGAKSWDDYRHERE